MKTNEPVRPVEPGHTPGPWEINHDKIEGVRPICQIYHPCGDVVDWPTETPDSGDMEAEANARLIAAAPDMYKFIQDVVDVIENATSKADRRTIADAARAAIAKAKGE